MWLCVRDFLWQDITSSQFFTFVLFGYFDTSDAPKEIEVQHILHYINMIAIGSYFVFIMFVLGTIADFSEISVDEKKQFFIDILKEHNQYRRMHKSLLLYLSEELIQLANDAVFDYTYDEIKKAKGFNYSKKSFFETSELNAELAKDIVADWYNTGANYNYDEEPTSETADPFTQIIWRDTIRLAVGIIWHENNLYVAVSYSYEGNIKGNGEYFRNVRPPKRP